MGDGKLVSIVESVGKEKKVAHCLHIKGGHNQHYRAISKIIIKSI